MYTHNTKMTKKRINITINKEYLDILRQAEKLNPTKTNRSQLIEYAVKKTFKNKIESLREQAKEYQRKIMEIKDTIKKLEKTK